MTDKEKEEICPQSEGTVNLVGGWSDKRTCKYCGSMHPDDFMDELRKGTSVCPTDKSYKAYVGDASKKFYYNHLSEDQMIEFIELYNLKQMTIGFPGHFYVSPFFMVKRGI